MQIFLNLKDLPSHVMLFSFDAKSMYTNIDLDHLLLVMKDWLYLHQNDLPDSFPVATILETIELVMENNCFYSGDTRWHQKVGKAMGTLYDCIIATIYCAHYEKSYHTSQVS
mmetsp:Transcript_15622/g.15019  ORF Transcript_15622/g.15019 Transcript_15622/m.15019 type:complete len:112 (-) Transcript_15622:57-392(-)